MYIFPAITVFADVDFPFSESTSISLPPSWGYQYVGNMWNDVIQSVIVFSGTWAFFEDGGFSGKRTIVGPGWYPSCDDPQFGLDNKTISSILCVSDQPQGDHPMTGSG